MQIDFKTFLSIYMNLSCANLRSTVILILTGLALVLFTTLLAWLVWAIRSGQWDDLDTPAHRMLGEDPPARIDPPARTDL